jgi:AraC-like DNA-binding protein
MHRHLSYSLGIVVNGSRQLIIGKSRLLIASGDVFMINSNQPHAIEPTMDPQHNYLIVSMDAGWLADQLRCPQPQFYTVIESDLIRKELSVLFDLIIAGNTEFDEGSFVGSLIKELSYMANEKNDQLIWDERIQRAGELLNRRFSENLRLDSIARNSFLSPFHFARLFKKQTGMAPHQYLLDNRLRYARKLLEEQQAVADVAIMSGFYDASHFIRHFSKFYGVTPLEYQQGILTKIE